MASVFELARTLGEELQKTPQVEALLAAKKHTKKTLKFPKQ